MSAHLARFSTNLSQSTTGIDARLGEKTIRIVQSGFCERSRSSSSHEKRRIRLWELASSLHCSIIGTCLSTKELRQILVRLKVNDADIVSDHDLHGQAVWLAARPQCGGKFLQKALDGRHRGAINQFAKAKDVPTLSVLWADAVKRGEIPGAYWAVLTHPAASAPFLTQVFGEVHMLSHLVGAANRADIRRLRQLEEDNAALAAKVERQQRQLRDSFAARDETIRRLNELLLAGKIAAPLESSTSLSDLAHGNGAAVHDALAEMDRRVTNETARRERMESRLSAISQALELSESARRQAESERDALNQEFVLLENRIVTSFQTEPMRVASSLDLSGLAILYVGGRQNQIPQMKAIVERAGARFFHYDGGIEHSPALLPGLVSRADIAFFPVDCVSHDAAASLKRLCSQAGKRYVPIRTASLACLSAALLRCPYGPNDCCSA